MQVGFGPIYFGFTLRFLLVLLGLLIATMALHLMSVLAAVSRWFAERMLDRHPGGAGTQTTAPIRRHWANETRTWDT
jgi:hypothetical protein